MKLTRFCFSPQSTRMLTASADCTCRLWDNTTGICVETLSGHTDEIICCAFNYLGNWIITASQDNTVIQWEANRTDQVF